MKPVAALLLAVASAFSTPAAAQAFVNLDFDQATLPPPIPPPGPVVFAWSDAIPGWSHSDGDSTEHVYYLAGHLGFSQWYALVDLAHSPFGGASGAHAVAIHSGTFREHEPRGDFTTAFLAQSGQVPAGAQTLSLLSSSHRFTVTLNGTGILMQPAVDDPTSVDPTTYSGEWRGDIAAFAGQVVDLRIADGAIPTSAFTEPLVIDEIRFMPVPEPSTFALMGLGALVLLGARRRSATLHAP